MPGFSNYSTQLTFLHTYSRIIFEIINKPFQPYCVRFYIRCTDTSAITHHTTPIGIPTTTCP